MAKLKNMQRRLRTFNLEHSAFVDADGEYPAGKPEVLTLMPKEVKVVRPEVLECREIRAALYPKNDRPTLQLIK